MTRQDKVQAIYKIAKERKTNINTLTFFLAMTSDKGVTRFYNEFVLGTSVAKKHSEMSKINLDK